MKKIRLQQKGKKKQAFYTLVVTEERSKQSGKVNEKVGYYNPMKDNTIVAVNKESILTFNIFELFILIFFFIFV